MPINNAVIAVYDDHLKAEAAVKQLTSAGFEMKNLSVIGKGYHTEEKVIGFYNIGDKIKVWGSRGAFWGGLWGLFFGGMFLVIPVVGHVMLLGYIAAAAFSAVEGAVIVGALGAVGAALTSIGVPKDSLLRYETAIKADGFLVMAHGSAEEMAHAKEILGTSRPSHMDTYQTPKAATPADHEPAMQQS